MNKRTQAGRVRRRAIERFAALRNNSIYTGQVPAVCHNEVNQTDKASEYEGRHNSTGIDGSGKGEV